MPSTFAALFLGFSAFCGLTLLKATPAFACPAALGLAAAVGMVGGTFADDECDEDGCE